MRLDGITAYCPLYLSMNKKCCLILDGRFPRDNCSFECVALFQSSSTTHVQQSLFAMLCVMELQISELAFELAIKTSILGRWLYIPGHTDRCGSRVTAAPPDNKCTAKRYGSESRGKERETKKNTRTVECPIYCIFLIPRRDYIVQENASLEACM